MPNLAADFTRLSAILLILFVGLLLTEYSAAGKTLSFICTAYCDANGQLVEEFPCTGSDSRRFYSTRKPLIVFCCGNATAKYCCSDLDKSISIGPKTYCGSNSNNTTTNNSDDWVIIVGIIMTVVFLLLGLIGSLCLCHRRCQCKNTIYSENGDIIRPHNSRQTSETGQATAPPDFDPSSPCAFAPPAYDTLSKNPPSYREIFTISHTSNGLPPPGSSESPPSTALCLEARDAWPEQEEEDEEPTGPRTPPSPQNLGQTEEL